MHEEEQFLNDLDKKLWTSADTYHAWQSNPNVGRVSDSVTRQTVPKTFTNVGLRDKAANPTYQNTPGCYSNSGRNSQTRLCPHPRRVHWCR